MKAFLEFAKTTAIGGLIVIIPLTILMLVLGQLLSTLVSITAKVGVYLPFSLLGNTVVLVLIAVIAIVLLCFVTGLLLQTTGGKALSDFLERHIAKKIPMYDVLKNLTAQFAGISGRQFQSVEADLYGADTWVLGFIVEDLPDGRLAIFVPSIPMATVGQVYYIHEQRVRKLDVPMMDVVNAITQWGVGSKEVFEKNSARKDVSLPQDH